MRNSISNIFFTFSFCIISIQLGLSCSIFSINVPEKACVNTPVVITASGAKTAGCFDDFTQKITVKQAQPGSNPVIKQLDNVGNNVEITFDKPGKYLILYTFKDGACASGGTCEGEKEIEILEPRAEFFPKTIEVCKGSTFSTDLVFSTGATRATVENKDKSFKVAIDKNSESNRGVLEYNLAVTQNFKLYISRSENSVFQCVNEQILDSISVIAIDLPSYTIIDTICDAANENYSLRFKLKGVGDTFDLSEESKSRGELRGDTLITNFLPSLDSFKLKLNISTVCEELIVEGAAACKCTILAGEMPSVPTFGCESGEIELMHDASTLELRQGDNLLFVLHTGKTDTLEQILNISDLPIFGVPSSEFIDSQLYVSAVVGPYTIEGFDINSSVCRNITFGTPVLWVGRDSFSIEGKLDVCANEMNRMYEVHLTNGTLKQPSTQSWILEDGSGATITDQNKDRIFLNFPNTNSSTLRYESLFKLTDELSCATSESIVINVDNSESAPAESEIILWPGDIFASTASDELCFQWGKIPKQGKFTRELFGDATKKFYYSDVPIIQSVLSDDVYFVAVYNNNGGCNFSFDNCNSIIFYNSAGVLPGLSLAEEDDFSMNIMPNPSDGNFRLELNGSYRGLYNVTILNDIGQKVQNSKVNKLYNTSIIDMELSTLNEGLYFIMISNEYGKREIIKTIIAK